MERNSFYYPIILIIISVVFRKIYIRNTVCTSWSYNSCFEVLVKSIKRIFSKIKVQYLISLESDNFLNDIYIKFVLNVRVTYNERLYWFTFINCDLESSHCPSYLISLYRNIKIVTFVRRLTLMKWLQPLT